MAVGKKAGNKVLSKDLKTVGKGHLRTIFVVCFTNIYIKNSG